MKRNHRRNSRAARRRHVEQLQDTIAGLQAMHQHAKARHADTQAELVHASRELDVARHTVAGLAKQLRERPMLIDSALRLVNMVRKECIARPATMSGFRPRYLRDHEWQFMLQEERFDARSLADKDALAATRTMQETMHVLRTLPTLVDRVNGHVHLRAVLANGQVGYAVGQLALMQGDEVTLAQRISEELAPALLRELRGARRGEGAPMAPRHHRYHGY